MRENRLYGSEGGGAACRSPYPYRMSAEFFSGEKSVGGCQSRRWVWAVNLSSGTPGQILPFEQTTSSIPPSPCLSACCKANRTDLKSVAFSGEGDHLPLLE